MAVGGNWERILGGVLTLHLPPHERDAIVNAFNDLFNKIGASDKALPHNPSINSIQK